ncbi:HAD-IA family hydrolase [Rhizobium sp. CF142]|uniref:HAD-IA family hydrolase n=1 Tax=Rhizobium sp. CF142 TaxID=1144314 RepID=UPI00026F004A|nr:HAD-IA family hydrolase [Rhizobium sp. CF142]EJJ30976.1 haloacid dehalogenase superfamily protein, subfamily IA, variant 3 with third motif having DD or ED [Rhizobium sp. CF142]
MKILMVDVDGVLVHGRPADGLPLFTYLERDLGLSAPLLQQEFFKPYWVGIVTGQEPIEPRLTEVLGRIAPHLNAQTLLDYWFENDSRLDRQLLDDLARLKDKGTLLYLATNQEHQRAAYLRDVLGLGALFDGMFYSAALGTRKPLSDFFRLATQEVGAAPDDIGFIDDVEENILAAKDFGWKALHWTPASRLADAIDAFTHRDQATRL